MTLGNGVRRLSVPYQNEIRSTAHAAAITTDPIWMHMAIWSRLSHC
jgi:hypothetical protein